MSRSAPIRILVVDDFQSYRKFISSSIQQKSEWQVVGEAADGLEGVNRAQELQPDLVLLDIGLPQLNGIEAARRIRTLAPRSRIVFLSQECSAEVVAEARHLGTSGYISKDSDEILPLVFSKGRSFVRMKTPTCAKNHSTTMESTKMRSGKSKVSVM